MTLQQFLTELDRPNTIVLLEGKREVLEADKEKLTALGKLVAASSKHMLFRSGNANGADLYFSAGVAEINRARLQVITPYDDHRKKTNVAYDTISLDQVDLAAEPDVIYQSKQNQKTKKLIEKYVSGDRDRYSIKAAYIIRDTIKVIGTTTIKPCSFGIFYDDLTNPMAGGTGHTMHVCKQNRIPYVDQRTWFNWLKGRDSLRHHQQTE